jgi:alcohol dehydrogenase class IV
MQFNRPSCTTEYAAIARAMSVGDSSDNDDTLADKAIDAMATLFDSVNIPRTLADLKMPEDKIDWAAEQAFGAARLINNNPRTLTVDSLISISQAAFSGNRAALAG